jgi:hypothetical protein
MLVNLYLWIQVPGCFGDISIIGLVAHELSDHLRPAWVVSCIVRGAKLGRFLGLRVCGLL